MCGLAILLGILLGAASLGVGRIEAQPGSLQGDAAQGSAAYRLRVSVDEVVLTFHAADAHGFPVSDLKLNELQLLDNDRPPANVLSFQLMRDAPIRAGILMDTSESMEEHIASNRAIALEYAQRLMHRATDRAFVEDFVRRERMLQPWTNDPAQVIAGVRQASAGAGSMSHGTAIFDTVYRACRDQFGKIDAATTGNFILLFSDGDDNASDVSLADAVDMCQQTNTAIYAFRAEDEPGFGPGPTALAQVTAQTGGRVFPDDDSEAGIYADLRTIEGNLRDQYRLVYRPAELKHDGAFHRITLVAPDRVDRIAIRSGYYASKQ